MIRKVLGISSHGIRNPLSTPIQYADALLDAHPDALTSTTSATPTRDHQPDSDVWMDYAWAPQTEYVNQYGYLPEWRAHVARFAHGFDSLPGFESFQQLSAAQKATAFRVGQTIGGHAWERLGFWTSYDASLSGDWKLPIVFDPVKESR